MKRLWVGLTVFLALLLVLVACGQTAAPSPTASKTPAPATAPKTTEPAAPTTKPTSATPKAAPVSFAGKTITIVTPYVAGGSTDIIARVYSRFLPKYIPGNPNIVVRNIPGGAATIGANFVYAARPDGMTALLTGSSVNLQQLMRTQAVKFDLLKMPTATALAQGYVYYVKSTVVSKPEDIVKAKGLIYGSSPGTSAWLFVTSKEVLNIPVDKAILAYEGGGDSLRAFISGELNFSSDTTAVYTTQQAAFVAKGEVLPLFQTGLLDSNGNSVKDPGLPADMLTLAELYQKIYGKPISGTAWDAFKAVLAAGRLYDKLLALPPDTPAPIVKVYWDAAEAMIKDPEFLKVANGIVGQGAKWSAGEAIQKEFRQNFAMDPKLLEWLKSTLAKYGVVVE